jgi:hypothetical protein
MLIGCSSTRIQTNKDATYVKKLDRVLISNSLNNLILFGRSNAEGVTKGLSDRLSKYGVIVQTVVPYQNIPESEEGKQVKEAIATFKPSQLMELLPISVRIDYNNNNFNFKLESSIYDAATMKTVWRSQIESSETKLLQGSELDTDKLVDAVVKKLEEDGLLSPLLIQQSTKLAQKAAQASDLKH